ncbi:MAG: biotin/lipoyl-containing protein, partial [Microbacterium sp.]
MAQIIRMPEVLAGAAEAAIQSWLIAPGETIAVGQPLAEIETDKAVVEFESETAGIAGRLLAAEGESIRVGEPILVLTSESEDAAAIDAALAAEGIAVSA